MNTELNEKAQHFEEFIEDHFVDEQGRVFTMLDKATKCPPEEDFFADAGERTNIMDFSVPGFLRRDVAMYENSGMCTGAYLMALTCRFKVEKCPAVLEKMRRCFNALKLIFEMGTQLETGFFPKTYGGRFSDETSSDQCLYASYSMHHYYEFATNDEKREIDFMIPAIADFWRKRKYIYNYWDQKDMRWPVFRFPIFMLIAYNHSNEQKFKAEYERLISDWDINYPQQFNMLGNKRSGKIPPNEYEKKYKAWVVSSMPDYFTMRMMELDYMLTRDPENSLAPRWKQSVLDMWDQAKLAIAPNYKAYHSVLVDMETGELRRPPTHELRASTMGWSTMIARAAVQALKFHPGNSEMRDTVTNILTSLDIDGMTYFDEPERLPQKERFKTRFLSGDATTHWLWAYWRDQSQ